MARSRAKARPQSRPAIRTLPMQGQPAAERVSRPAREKNRRRRVLVVAIRFPDRSAPSSGPGRGPSSGRPARHRWRRWRPEGRWFSPTPYLRTRSGILDLGWRRWSGSSSQLPVPDGDGRDQLYWLATRARWEPGVGFTRRTMSRTGAASASERWKGVQVVSATHRRHRPSSLRNRRPGIFGYRLDEIARLLCWRMVME